MKKIYNSKLFWIIISCILSFVLWIYVTSVQSDEVRQTFRGVRVELVGENVLRDSRSLVITDLSTSTVSFLAACCASKIVLSFINTLIC